MPWLARLLAGSKQQLDEKWQRKFLILLRLFQRSPFPIKKNPLPSAEMARTLSQEKSAKKEDSGFQLDFTGIDLGEDLLESQFVLFA